MKVDKSNQCFFITPLLDTLSMKTFHKITGTTIALVILSARFMVLVEVDLVRKKGGEVKYTIGSRYCLYINNNLTWSTNF